MLNRIDSVVRAIAADEQLEARWLLTLSYLEYVAMRKITRTVAASHASPRILEHVADESRHAAVFSGLATAVLGAEPGDYLCRDAAGKYFARLDRELSAWVEDIVGGEHPELNYLLVTAMVERRATTLYPAYRDATSNARVRSEINRIIAEEQDHLSRIETECIELLATYGISDLSAPTAVESAFFAEFWTALETALMPMQEPAAAA